METLCWSCTKPGKCLCLWDASKAMAPVEGWKAIPTKVRIQGCEVPSYLVIDCPLYEKDKTAEVREYRRGAPTSLSNADLISWVKAGLTDKEIAWKVGLKPNSVQMRRLKLRKEGLL